MIFLYIFLAIAVATLVVYLIVARKKKLFPFATRTKMSLSDAIRSAGGEFFEDYLLVDRIGKGHRIDFILANKYGIFVIVKDDAKCALKGSDVDQYWVRRVGEKEETILNPGKSNYRHVAALKEILGKDLPFSLCIVCDRCNFREAHSAYLHTTDTLRKFLLSRTKPVLTDEEVVSIGELLASKRAESIDERDDRDDFATERASTSPRCPYCGGHLEMKGGAGHRYYVCENAPECKYRKSLEL